MGRAGYEFDTRIKQASKERAGFVCERCGKETDKLEIHHILPIAIAIKYYPRIAPEVIRSLANAQCLCKECHKKADVRARQNHEAIAQNLVRVSPNQMKLC